jgi:hypothetical protein
MSQGTLRPFDPLRGDGEEKAGLDFMTPPMHEAIEQYFDGKPKTHRIFKAVHDYVHTLGPFQVSVGSQISLGVNRKFAWFWLYNVTQKNPNGTLHAMLRLDQRIDDPHIRQIDQISKNRWNHQIIIRTAEDARSKWFKELIRAAYNFGGG